MANISSVTELCIQINNVWRTYSCKKITYTETSKFCTYEFTLVGLAIDIKLNTRVTAIEVWDRPKLIAQNYEFDGFITNVVTDCKPGESKTFVYLQVTPGYSLKPSYNSEIDGPKKRETNVTISLSSDTSQYEMNKRVGVSQEALDNLLDSVPDVYKTTGYFSSFIKPKETKVTKVEVPIPKTELLAINVRRSIKIEP